MNTPTDIVQAAYGDFGRGDIPALLARLTDDVLWEHKGTLDLPYMGVFRGKEAVARWFGHVAEFDGIEAFEPREFLAGTDHVTVLGWERTRALAERPRLRNRLGARVPAARRAHNALRRRLRHGSGRGCAGLRVSNWPRKLRLFDVSARCGRASMPNPNPCCCSTGP